MRRHRLITLVAGLTLGPASLASAATTSSIPLPGGVTNPQFAAQYPDSNDILVADWTSNKLWRLPNTPFAGSGLAGPPADPNGDGGSPQAASFDAPTAIAFLRDGAMLVADTEHHKIRLVRNGLISTIAGDGTEGTIGALGDGGPATAAHLRYPVSVAVLPDGKSFLIADSGHHVIRRVDGDTGVITTVAGNGTDAEVDGPNASASFSFPQSVAVETNGKTALVADRVGRTIRRVGLEPGGAVTTVAGPASGDTTPVVPWNHAPPTGTYVDDEDALTAGFSPTGVLSLADGSFLVFDAGNDRVRRVKNGDVETLVGTGVRGDGADGQAPTATDLYGPSMGYVDRNGDLVVLDWGAKKLRRVTGLNFPSAATDPKPKVEPLPPLPETVAVPRNEPLLPVPLAPVPAPVMGKSVGVAPGSGVVRVRKAGTRSFVVLAAGASLPVGSVVDTRDGSVNLTSAAGAGKTQTAAFTGGMFEVRQKPRTAVTDLHLRGSLAGCPKAWQPTARAAARKRPTRRLWGDGKGRFRTHGSSAVATVRGTKWLTEDRCYGTLVKVSRGVVDVKATRGKKVFKVRAGQQRLVRSFKRR